MSARVMEYTIYYASCNTCDWHGEDCDSESVALRDAADHNVECQAVQS